MASRVLLISINTYTTPDPVFPLGMAHVGAALRQAGHEVAFHDMLSDSRPVQDALAAFRPDCVGISVRNIDDVLIRKRQTFFGDVADLCGVIRSRHQCPIVIGGSGFTMFPGELLKRSGADYGVQGEGEETFTSLLAAMDGKRTPNSIPGLVYWSGDEVVLNAPRSMSARPLVLGNLCEELGQFYLRNGGMLSVQTQRGCAHRCCYCTYPVIEGRHYRRRSGEEVVADFESAVRAGARYLFIVDSVFNSSPAHVSEVCEAVLRRNLKVPWGAFLRPQGLTRESLKLMAAAGLSHIEFGSDSFSDKVLEASDKGLTFEDILKSSELATRQNLDYCHFLICGGPGETPNTLQEGFERSKRLDGAIMMAVVGMRIYPGTALFEIAVKEGVVRRDADLLQPTYYLAPGLEAGEVFTTLKQFASTAPNWILGDPNPEYIRMVERLRARGVAGPLWSYAAMVQRLSPRFLMNPPDPAKTPNVVQE